MWRPTAAQSVAPSATIGLGSEGTSCALAAAEADGDAATSPLGAAVASLLRVAPVVAAFISGDGDEACASWP